MKLVLDTSALWDRALLETIGLARVAGALDDGRLAVALPAVAYAERLRQVRLAGRDVAAWRERLEDAGIVIEPFGEAEADGLDPLADDHAAWHAHGRDFLVAAHAHGDRWAVTRDAGPAWRSRNVLSPAQATEAIRDILSP
jgi:hypothetical protein